MNKFEQEVFDAIQATYTKPEWITMPLVRVGTGYAKVFGGDRTIDALVINAYPSKNYKCMAVEIKKSMSDLTADISNPLKHAAIRFYSDEFYYAFDINFYQQHKEIIRPKVMGVAHAGIMVMLHGRISIICKEWHPQAKSPWPFGFVCSLLRKTPAEVEK